MNQPDSFIKNCQFGLVADVCPKTTISVTPLGFCLTMFSEGTPAYVVNNAGIMGAFSFEVDIMQDDYSSEALNHGAGISVNKYATLPI